MQFLLIARVAEGVSMEQVLPHVKAEAKAVWEKYSSEIVRSIYHVAEDSPFNSKFEGVESGG